MYVVLHAVAATTGSWKAWANSFDAVSTRAVLCCVALMPSFYRLVHFLETHRSVGPMIFSIKKMAAEILSCIALIFTILLANAATFHLLFMRAPSEKFATFGASLTTLFSAALGDFSFEDHLPAAQPSSSSTLAVGWSAAWAGSLGNALLVVHIMLLHIVGLNLMIGVVASTYEEYRAIADGQHKYGLALSVLELQHQVEQGCLPAPLNAVHAIAEAVLYVLRLVVSCCPCAHQTHARVEGAECSNTATESAPDQRYAAPPKGSGSDVSAVDLEAGMNDLVADAPPNARQVQERPKSIPSISMSMSMSMFSASSSSSVNSLNTGRGPSSAKRNRAQTLDPRLLLKWVVAIPHRVKIGLFGDPAVASTTLKNAVLLLTIWPILLLWWMVNHILLLPLRALETVLAIGAGSLPVVWRIVRGADRHTAEALLPYDIGRGFKANLRRGHGGLGMGFYSRNRRLHPSDSSELLLSSSERIPSAVEQASCADSPDAHNQSLLIEDGQQPPPCAGGPSQAAKTATNPEAEADAPCLEPPPLDEGGKDTTSDTIPRGRLPPLAPKGMPSGPIAAATAQGQAPSPFGSTVDSPAKGVGALCSPGQHVLLWKPTLSRAMVADAVRTVRGVGSEEAPTSNDILCEGGQGGLERGGNLGPVCENEDQELQDLRTEVQRLGSQLAHMGGMMAQQLALMQKLQHSQLHSSQMQPQSQPQPQVQVQESHINVI